MDTAKAQPIEQKRAKGAPTVADLIAKARAMRVFNIQFFLIVPYLLLTLIVAMVGIFIIMRLVVESQRERFYNSLVDASRVSNDGVVRQERLQLDRVRQVAFFTEMPSIIIDARSEQATEIMQSAMLTGRFDILTAVDRNGREILTLGRTSTDQEYHRSQGADLNGYASIPKVLNGVVDKQGDKYVELMETTQGPVMFTVVPVRDSSNKIVGALMGGTYLKTLLNGLKDQALSEIAVFDYQGRPVDATVSADAEGMDDLLSMAAQLNPATRDLQVFELSMNQRNYEVAFSPLVIREQNVGWIAVLKNSEYLVKESANSRIWFIGLFTAGALAVILIGYFLAQNIARPILKLRTLSQAVAAGDLNQKSGLNRSDEIGELAEAFDVMTLHLRERTEEAARLYQETLQRNRELAEINAKLEAAQLQLIQSEKLAAIGQLTAGIVHDVKNPFAVIMGMSEVLADDEALDESVKHGLKVIRESAVKGNTIVSDLLKFARQSKSEMREADLGETVRTAMRLTAYLTRRYNQNNELPDHSFMVHYDAQQIEQVLINLIHNAVQAMPNGGSLNIRLRRVGETAQISIQDTGSGISPEHLKRIFDPFFTTKPEGEGTGLGLSVSYGIIANHYGKIEVESELGKGTTFIITLPISQPSS